MIDYSVYKMTKEEWFKAILLSLAVVWGLTYLFYKNILIMLLASPFSLLFIRFQKEQLKEKRAWELNIQFKEALLSLSTALNAGYSIENAVYQATKDLLLLYDEDAYIIKEFQYMLYELQVNKTIEEIFLEFAARTHLEDVTNFVDVFITAKRTGGNIMKIIGTTSKNINDKIEVRREIQTMITAKQYESNIMCIVPLGIIVYMWISSPGYMDVLYNNIFGILVMSVLLAIYVAAYLLCNHLTKIKI
ncbi:MAG: type II secretion system F family protein [bacterium]|nr:type II secretion system F family protein [bacterium]